MALAPIVHFDCLAQDLPHGLHAWNTHTLNIALTNTEPDPATDTLLTDIVDLTTAGGYPIGGYPLTVVSSGQTAGIYRLIVDDFSITATGGDIDPWRFGVCYNTVTSKLICYWTYNPTVPIVIADTESYDFEFDAVDGILPMYFVV